MTARAAAEREARRVASETGEPAQPFHTADPLLAAVLEAPVIPLLPATVPRASAAAAGGNGDASTGSGGDTVIVIQHVLTPPFTLEWSFLQEGCFGEADGAAAPAAAPVASQEEVAKEAPPSPPSAHAPRDWARLAESLGVGIGSSDDEAALYRARYEAELCSRMGLCAPSTAAGAATGAPALSPAVYAAASAGVANLIGSVTYFHGRQIVDPTPVGLETLGHGQAPDHRHTHLQPGQHPQPFGPPAESEAPHGLYTGVPSRSFFPRGFLWDEGFHQVSKN